MPSEIEHVDVLIVGAGLSGIGAACHLQRQSPGKSYAILEARDAIGGTWDLFRYPGVRSDSDMFTLGYSFRPWEAAEAIADGPAIREYVVDTAKAFGVEDHIRFNQQVVRAEFSTAQARWTVETASGARFSSQFLFWCSGYYRYDEGFTPDFAGIEEFEGRVVHPQHWPEDLDYAGKRVVVIGSGATAVTLVPAMAQDAAHVTMLQRSPTYIATLPGIDPLAQLLARFLPAKVRYPVIRWKNVLLMMGSYQLSRRRPGLMKKILRADAKRHLPAGYDIDLHFGPSYDPWDQRLCVVPDGDLFRAIRHGKADVETDRIARFTPGGILLESGKEIEADVVITATGLNLVALGGARLARDGQDVDISQSLSYKGMMLSGLPNMALVIGYTNASWTLKCDLVCQYVCRLINFMDEKGYDACVPEPDPSVGTEPFIDLASGYVQRALDQFPKQGDRAPWKLRQNYVLDLASLRYGDVEDGAMRFSRAEAPAAPRQPVAA